MMISGMNHFTVLSHDLDATVAFYEDILGLKNGFRPGLGFPGAWLYVGELAILHVIAGRALPENRSGVLDHMAFSGSELNTLLKTLKSKDIKYEMRKQVDTGIWQVFFYDPSGARVEVDFEASEVHSF
tara:strand:- start:1068 stop:1451 length:384 start_codon:yes stop_codon:yes gene_type:complete